MKADERSVFTTTVTAVERPQRRAMLDIAWMRQYLASATTDAKLPIWAEHLGALLDIAEAALACTLAPQLPERVDRLFEITRAAFVGEPTVPEAQRSTVDVVRLREIAGKAFVSCTIADLDAAQSALEPLLEAYEGTLQTQPGQVSAPRHAGEANSDG
jgi:hypothetical protein